MGETGLHVRAIMCLYSAMRVLFGMRNDVYIAADMFLYYEKGNPRANKSPDVMLVKGVRGNHERDSFKLWTENAVPSVIFEVTSPSTWKEDPINKKPIYERIGVQEYFIFDPLDHYLDEPLLGFRLNKGKYSPIPHNEDGSMTSLELGITLHHQGHLLRSVSIETGELILWEETWDMLRESMVRAEKETQRAEQEAQRAEQEAQRAAEAEAENERLRALLAQMQGKQDG
ncbi:MAG: Uma2 family endonuclease [Chloroflexota bacterium]|nr:Uma2 family endonuclease [Chloroflexota bacterium]